MCTGQILSERWGTGDFVWAVMLVDPHGGGRTRPWSLSCLPPQEAPGQPQSWALPWSWRELEVFVRSREKAQAQSQPGCEALGMWLRQGWKLEHHFPSGRGTQLPGLCWAWPLPPTALQGALPWPAVDRGPQPHWSWAGLETLQWNPSGRTRSGPW